MPCPYFFGQVIVWDRGRPARKRGAGAPALLKPSSRFALIAGGTPAVPADHLSLQIVGLCEKTDALLLLPTLLTSNLN